MSRASAQAQFRQCVLQMVSAAEIGKDAAMALLRKAPELTAALAPPEPPAIAAIGAALSQDGTPLDGTFFGLTHDQSTALSAEQAALMEAAFHAAEAAGYGAGSPSPHRAGVFWRSDRLGPAASALCERLGLDGPRLALHAAESAPLAEIHLACDALRAGSCDIALAIASGSDRMQAGAIMLKRLPDAQRDGDRIHALLRASGIGRSTELREAMGQIKGAAEASALRCDIAEAIDAIRTLSNAAMPDSGAAHRMIHSTDPGAAFLLEPAPAPAAPAPQTDGPCLCVLSAQSPAALRRRAEDLIVFLAQSSDPLADIAHSLAIGRAHYAHRLAVAADDRAALREALRNWLDGVKSPRIAASGGALGAEVPEALRTRAETYLQGNALAPDKATGRPVELPGYPLRVGEGPDALAQIAAAMGAVDTPMLTERAEGFALVERWGCQALAEAYGRAGLFERRVYTLGGLAKALGVLPAQRRAHGAHLEILTRMGLLTQEGDVLRLGDPPTPGDPAAERDAIAGRDPALTPLLVLLDRCVQAVPELLSGKASATEIMFPQGKMDLVEPIYRGNPIADHFNRMLAAAVIARAEAQASPLRILEIGAGTGGATAGILAALDAAGLHARYTYTDLSKGFVQYGQAHFGAGREDMVFLPFDIAADPSPQGLQPASFDLILASNVIHACPRIDNALATARHLLAEEGLLLLNELTARQDYATLTFGITDGWWAFDDPERRMAHAPLLDIPGWQRALAAAGFGATAVAGLPWERPNALSQAVIAAGL